MIPVEYKDNYLTVARFARLTGIPASKLRFYDRKGLFIPAERGEGRENKYRYYSPMQATTIKMVRVLAEIGVPLETIKALAEERTPEMLMKLLTKNKRILADEIRYLQDVYSVICTFLELITEGISADENEISVREMPEMNIVLGELTDFSYEDGFIGEYLTFCTTPRRPKLNLSYPVGGYFSDMDSLLCHPSEPNRFFSLDPDGLDKKEKGLYLTGYTRGYYGKTNDLPKRMETYAKKNGIIFNGPVYHIYLFDELSVKNPDQYLLQITAGVREPEHTLSPHPRRRFKKGF